MNEILTPPVQEEQTPPQAAPQAPGPRKKKLTPKLRRRIIAAAVAVVLVVAVVVLMYRFLTKSDANVTINDAMVQLGSITSMVEGSGTAKAKDSSSITLTTAGTVVDVYVSEGDYVEQGTPLFTVDSPNAEGAVVNARNQLQVKQKELDDLYEAADSLIVTAPFAGKILLGENSRYEAGDPISPGATLGTLVDDRTLLLEQYYSYAYENDIHAGQEVMVSIPAVMEQRPGRVEAVHKVSRISPEGSRLFLVQVSLQNPGTLTADMAASAVITAGGQTIYPYEQGKLQYNRTETLQVKAEGDVIRCDLLDYMDVEAGQVLMQIDGADNELALYNAQEALRSAQEELQKAEQNLQNLNAVAPISGTVMGLTIAPGQEFDANTTVISISDTSLITVTAQVDERNISYVKAGMSVTINQWGVEFMGVVDSVSLTPEMNNGMASYPATITVDNSMGAETGNSLMPGSTVTYSLVASQSDGCLVLPIQCVKYVPDPNSETGETMSVVFLKADTPPETLVEGVDGTAMGVPAQGYYPVPVETGISDKYNVEIISGLAEGDTVFQNTTQDMMMY